jgi:REP element-mobilizing transposase RayT
MKIRHGKDLRRGRYSERGRPFLVNTVTHERRAIFRDLKIACCLIRELRDATELRLVDTVAWVVMPDHLHWLFSLRAQSLSAVTKRVKSRSGIAINRYLGLSGPVWQKGFHDHALRQHDDLEIAARYVIANPLRAGLVEDIHDYPLWYAEWVERRIEIEF